MQLLVALWAAYLLVAETNSLANEMEIFAHFNPPFARAAQEPPDSRIFNGVTATTPLPFIASIQAQFQGGGWAHFCGGSLIKPNKILTAAHCMDVVKRYNGYEFRVALGSTNHLNPVVSVEFGLKDVEVDTRYSNKTSRFNPIPYDFALIHLRRPVKLSQNIATISLAKKEYEGAITIAGWGKVDCVYIPLYLFLIQGNTVAKKKCEGIYSSRPNATGPVTFGPDKICALARSPNDSSSGNPDRGDSGGPLYFLDNEAKPILLGIVSFGILHTKPSTCFRTEIPFVFAKVSANLGFIEAAAVLNFSIICKSLTFIVCTYTVLFSL